MGVLTLAVGPVAEPVRRFVLFGGLHLLILFTTVALPAALSVLVRRGERAAVAKWLAGGMAAILAADYVFTVSWALHVGKIDYWAKALPMHLCDWASIVVIVALLNRRQLPYELAYFWGLSGTFQAVLTPDVHENFPNPLFISFFVSHCGIIISVLFLTWGIKLRPQPGAVWRAWGWSQLYLVCAGVVNWIFRAHGINFGYLAAKPPHGSLLDFFGPWPWYILTLEAMALVFYTAFYLPFWIGRQRVARTGEKRLISAP